MISRSLKATLLVAIAMTMTSCDQFLKGKPKPPQIIEIKASELACVDQIEADLKKLVESTASEQDIDNSFNCLNKTLDQFRNRAEGRNNPEAFNNEELYVIFETFFNDAQISEQATENILLLKKALLGGAENEITKKELDLLKDYLKLLQKEVKNLAPYMKVFSFDKNEGPIDPRTLNLAFSQLRASLKELLRASKIARAAYDFEDLKQLIVNLNLVKDDKGEELLSMVESVVQLLAGVEPLQAEADYLLAIDNFVDLASLYANVLYTDIRFEVSEKDQLNKAIDFVGKMITVLESSVQYTKYRQIPIKHLDPLVKEILKSKVLPVEVTETTFLNFYKKIIIRVFHDLRHLDIVSLESLKPVHFKNLKREYYIYKLYQEMINSFDFTVRTYISPPDLQNKIREYDFKKAWAKATLKKSVDTQLAKEVLLGLEEFRSEALMRLPIIYRQDKYVIAASQNTAEVSWKDVSRAHYTKMLARELMVGWGDLDPLMNLKKSRILKSGFIQWYSDFKEFAVETKLFDPDGDIEGSDNFNQADMFTYSGDGNNELSYLETLQYVSMLLSGGAEMTQKTYDTMIQAQCALAEKDIFGKQWIDEKCFSKNLRIHIDKLYPNLYLFASYVNKMNDSQYAGFFNELMDMARVYPETAGKVSTGDLRGLNLLSMFIESLFTVYDVRAPFGGFDAGEIRAAYPRFKGFIEDYTKKPDVAKKLDGWDAWYNICKFSYTKEEFLREAFVFLVYNGRVPEQKDVNKSCNFKGLFTFDGTVDRRRIISTFKILKTEIALGNAVNN